MTTGLAMPKRTDAPVKIDVNVLAKARIAAAYKGKSLAEYLSDALLPIVDKDIEEGHLHLTKPPTSAKKSK